MFSAKNHSSILSVYIYKLCTATATNLQTLRKVSCSHIDANHYLFDYANEVTDDINDIFNLNIGKKIMLLVK